MAASHSSLVSSRSMYMNDIDSDNINPDNLIVIKETQNTETQASEPSGKRKKMQPRSQAWQHFTRSESSDGVKVVCNYCEASFYCDSRKNGTTALNTHIKKCIKNPLRDLKSRIVSQPGSHEGGMKTWVFNQENVRKSLARMIVIDELPFRHVENKGFVNYMADCCPMFKIPSRWTVARDCYDMYLSEKSTLMKSLKASCQRVCLTTDSWTSLQRINYMVLTAHFIDQKWKLRKVMLNFCPISSHKGEEIGMAVEKCLREWGIDNIFTITVDNASSNDVAVGYLRKKLSSRGGVVLGGKYMHMRCIAHIINLVVHDGLRDLNQSVARVRAAVHYLRQSPARLKKFKEYAKIEKIDSNSLLSLDVSTRWNSTYLMLATTVKFEKAFERLADSDLGYCSEMTRGDGVITDMDWENVRMFVRFLEHFYDLTKQVSGSLYVTSSSSFELISNAYAEILEWQRSDSFELVDMTTRIKEKYDKYWGNIEKTNMLVYIGVILNPTRKLRFILFALKEMYGVEKGTMLGDKIKTAIYEIFEEYKRMNEDISKVQSTAQAGSKDGGSSSSSNLMARWWSVEGTEDEEMNSELDSYLSEKVDKGGDSYNIIDWWRLNSPRYPILGRMARDVLAIPVSTVASESAFSTGGRVLDAFRSSLSPKIVQALLCGQNWMRNSTKCDIELTEEESEQMESVLDDKLALDGVVDTLRKPKTSSKNYIATLRQVFPNIQQIDSEIIA